MNPLNLFCFGGILSVSTYNADIIHHPFSSICPEICCRFRVWVYQMVLKAKPNNIRLKNRRLEIMCLCVCEPIQKLYSNEFPCIDNNFLKAIRDKTHWQKKKKRALSTNDIPFWWLYCCIAVWPHLAHVSTQSHTHTHSVFIL